ncbi:MAG: sialate O-acetylesterase [Muribaculaceae bacterium]
MKKRILLILTICIFSAIYVSAKISLPSYFSNNMVLQQNSSVLLHGTAKKNAKVRINLGWNNETLSTQADTNGAWSVKVTTKNAGGPYNITISDGQKLQLNNILIGEVWLCSGQSNMEMPIAGWGKVLNFQEEITNANYPSIRLLQIKKATALVPQTNVDVNMNGWQECSPSSIPEFSSIAYFYARHLYNHLHIPIGVIDCTWGGTPAEAWASIETLKNVYGYGERISKILKNGNNVESIMNVYNNENDEWKSALLRKDGGMDNNGTAKWAATNIDDSNWNKMQLPAQWEKQGLTDFNGIVWFRHNVDITKDMAGKPLTLRLAMIDDEDITYFNSVKVGNVSGFSTPRSYTVPANLVKEGTSVITIRVSDFSGEGGIYGESKDFYVESAEKRISLAGDWKYSIGASFADMPPIPTSPLSSSQPSVLYNAMVNPLKTFPIKGAIWYQGEANVGRAKEYSILFPSLIFDWRKQWGYDFPFYFVQLANFLAHNDVQPQSTWAALREAQAQALYLNNTGMAVAIERGLADDIHPKDKQEIGRRLGQLALSKTYGKDAVSVAPQFSNYQIKGDKIIITFNSNNGKLKIGNNATQARGFIIAGSDKVFHKAQAIIEGDKIILSSPNVEMPMAARYGWADNPECNIYGEENIPVAPFRTDNW